MSRKMLVPSGSRLAAVRLAAAMAVLLAAISGAWLVASAAAGATACTLPPNPGGNVELSVIGEHYVGDRIPLVLEVNSQAESAYVDANSVHFQIVGPGGETDLADPAYPNGAVFTVPLPGSYTVTARWTETCDDGVSPPVSRGVTSGTTAFDARAIGPPDVAVTRLRRPAGEKWLLVAPLCDPEHALDQPLTMSARVRATGPRRALRTASWTQRHGCARQNFRAGRRIDIARARRLQPFASVDMSYRGLLLNALHPARASMVVKMRSGATLIAAVTVRFFPARHGVEAMRIERARCPQMPTGCIGP